MTTGVEEHHEVPLGRPELAEMPLQPRRRGALGSLAHYAGLLKRGLHFRYHLANLLSSRLK